MSFNRNSIPELVSGLINIPFFKKITSTSILKSIDFFSDVNNEALERVSEMIQICEFKKDEIICRHGKFDEYFYIILAGNARAIIPTEENPKYELYRLGKGDFFGEELIFSSVPRGNTIIVNNNLFAVSMNADALRELVNNSEKIRSSLDKKYIDRKLRNDLRKISIFTHLDDRLFEEVLDRVELISVPEKGMLFRQGDMGDAFYLIRNGEVNVYMQQDGKEKLISILGEGEFFGEMSLLSDEVRNASVEISKKSDLVKLLRDDLLDIVKKDKGIKQNLSNVIAERKENRINALEQPNMAFINRKLLDLNSEVNRHLDIISQCTIDTELGSALLASLPGSRYPYVYPRDSACASRFLYKLAMSGLKSGEIALRLMGEIARFILNCQRDDGYWGQRYNINAEDKGIYKQEDNVAHGITILCRYLLAAKRKGISIQGLERIIDGIKNGSSFALGNYYRNEIHLFFSTTSIHESAIEEGYSIWVNYAYLMMLHLIESVGKEYDILDIFPDEMELKKGFEKTIDNVFSLSGRYVRRLKPDGVVDLRPDITLLSPFFFGAGLDIDYFNDNELFARTIEFVEDTLWDPDLGMLQRYLPFIEDPDTHIHAGNGPWIQYTAMLAQYYFYSGNIKKGNEILEIINGYISKEGYLCEHLTTPERFYEFNRLEWLTGRDCNKEFEGSILIPGIPYDNIVDELNHMKTSYDEVEKQCLNTGERDYISFVTPLMWSHAEYAMALMLRTEKELKNMQ